MFRYIVQVHPVENGQPNLHKVKHEMEFGTLDAANIWIEEFNRYALPELERAVYTGSVNCDTGELI